MICPFVPNKCFSCKKNPLCIAFRFVPFLRPEQKSWKNHVLFLFFMIFAFRRLLVRKKNSDWEVKKSWKFMSSSWFFTWPPPKSWFLMIFKDFVAKVKNHEKSWFFHDFLVVLGWREIFCFDNRVCCFDNKICSLTIRSVALQIISSKKQILLSKQQTQLAKQQISCQPSTTKKNHENHDFSWFSPGHPQNHEKSWKIMIFHDFRGGDCEESYFPWLLISHIFQPRTCWKARILKN